MMSILHLNIAYVATYLPLKILVKCEYKTVSHFGLLQTMFSILKAISITSRKQIKSLPLVDGATSIKNLIFDLKTYLLVNRICRIL